MLEIQTDPGGETIVAGAGDSEDGIVIYEGRLIGGNLPGETDPEIVIIFRRRGPGQNKAGK